MIPHSLPSAGKAPDIPSVSVPDTLLALQVNPETGLTRADVDTRRKAHGYNEVAEQMDHPILKFLGKFWGCRHGLGSGWRTVEQRSGGVGDSSSSPKARSPRIPPMEKFGRDPGNMELINEVRSRP